MAADGRDKPDRIDACRARQHFGESGAVAAPGSTSQNALVLAVENDIVHAERAEIHTAGKRSTAFGRNSAARHVNFRQQIGVDIGIALRVMRGVAIALRHAVDHHVDAAGAFKTTDIDRHARIGATLEGEDACGSAQHIVQFRATETIDLFAVHLAHGRRDRGRHLCVVRAANGDRLQRNAGFVVSRFLLLPECLRRHRRQNDGKSRARLK